MLRYKERERERCRYRLFLLLHAISLIRDTAKLRIGSWKEVSLRNCLLNFNLRLVFLSKGVAYNGCTQLRSTWTWKNSRTNNRKSGNLYVGERIHQQRPPRRRRTDGETATEDGRTRGGRTDFFFATLTSPFLEFLLPSLARSFRPSVRLAR